MNFNIDSFYVNGKLHGHQGQDYALHGDNYFIICDGCSSSKHSDVAARLQAHIAKKFMDTFAFSAYDIEDNNFLVRFIAIELEEMFHKLFIDDFPLATLMIGFVVNDMLRVIVVGDGAIVYKNKHLDRKIITIEYNNSAPFYPYYYTSEKIKNEYKEKYPKVIKKTIYEIFYEYSTVERIDDIFIEDFDIDKLEYLYIFSDGIGELTGQQGKLPIFKAVKKFIDMKNINSTFIQRRCKRQMKLYEKESIFPQDDFSMAGIYL